MSKEEIEQIREIVGVGTKEVLTSDEAAQFLGVSKSNLYKLTMRRAIPHYKSASGRLVYFNRQELVGWMMSVKVATRQEINDKAVAITSKKGGRV